MASSLFLLCRIVFALISETDGRRFVAGGGNDNVFVVWNSWFCQNNLMRSFPITLITLLIIDRKLCMFFEMPRICVRFGKIQMFWYLFEWKFPKDLLRKSNQNPFYQECWWKKLIIRLAFFIWFWPKYFKWIAAFWSCHQHVPLLLSSSAFPFQGNLWQKLCCNRISLNVLITTALCFVNFVPSLRISIFFLNEPTTNRQFYESNLN